MSRNLRKHQRKRRGCLKWVLLIVLIVVVAGGGYAYYLYRTLNQTGAAIHVPRPMEQAIVREQSVNVEEKDPFSILLMGIDTGGEGRTDQGRSDVMLVVTVNPNTNRTTITSIPRDTRTIIAGRNAEDKINHAYAFGGTAMAVNTVQQLLHIPIDYTVSVDMGQFEQVVDAIGGVTITPIASFEQDGTYFQEGVETYMDGATALKYSRNRYDSGGDYGRQERQRQLIRALADSLLSVKNILSFGNIIQALGEVVTTDMTLAEMTTVIQDYRQAANHIETFQLSGEGTMIEGVYYDIPDSASLNDTVMRLKQELQLSN